MPPKKEKELQDLRRRRNKAITYLSRFEEFLNNIGSDDLAAHQLEIRIKTLHDKWQVYETTQLLIEDLDNTQDQEDEMVDYENKYLDLVARGESLKKSFDNIAPPANNNSTNNICNNNCSESSNLKLPPIKLPNFNGNMENWLSFHDLFLSVIDKNTSLTNVQKLYYLKSAVAGEAKNLIDSLELIDSNYSTAWNLLLGRFHHKNLIIQKHISALFDLPKAEKESAVQLRLLLDSALKHINTLDALKQPVEHWDTMLVHLISSKLDHKTQREWQLSVSPENLPTLEDIKTFLQQKWQMLESTSSNTNNNSTKTSTTSNKDQHKTNKDQHKQISSNKASNHHCLAAVVNQSQSSNYHSNNNHSSKNNINNNHSSKNHVNNNHSSNYQSSSNNQSSNNQSNSNHSSNYQSGSNHSNNYQSGNYHLNNNHTSRNFSNNINNQSFKRDGTRQSCDLCHLQHHLAQCPELLKLTPSQRAEQLNALNKCLNCIRSGHKLNDCRSPINCKRCFSRHNTLICQQGMQQNYQQANQSSSHSMHSSNYTSNQTVMLSTAMVYVQNKQGSYTKCRALLDCGSQSSYITESLVQTLGLHKTKTNMSVKGINEAVSSCTSHVNTNIKSANNLLCVNHTLYVLPKITDNIPSYNISYNVNSIPSNIVLADPAFYKPASIDMLIGADLFWDILDNQSIILNNSGIHLRSTKFGWIVTKTISSKSLSSLSTMCNLSIVPSLNFQMERFWEIEDCSKTREFSGEDKTCEDFYKQTTTTEPTTGRFIVKLPLREEPDVLGDSHSTAMKRFMLLERRFKRDPQLHQDYSAFMNEYISLGHMKPVTETNNTNINYFIPHHPVFKESTTTKLRVVFDASCKTTTGKSLNDIAIAGPNIQSSLISILIRFRTYPIVMTADVEKMYRQVLLHPSQRSLQSILWRENDSQPIQHYELQTVTYGVSSAAYLATRSLKEAAQDVVISDPSACLSIQEDHYVDDYLSGGRSFEEALQKLNSVRLTLENRGFHLRKWCSNDPKLLEHLPSESVSQELIRFDKEDIQIKTLGLIWNPISDHFQFTTKAKESAVTTKRSVLSSISQIFDPLGLIGPIITKAKCFMQHLWTCNINWDDELPGELRIQWDKYNTSLKQLDNFKIHRAIIPANSDLIQIHGFADASESAYGCCIYLRSATPDGTVTCNLVTSKSRVAPLKQTSLPRLELCAALLLAELLEITLNSLKLDIDQIYLWTDSQIVLTWLASPSTHWTTFVANRVAKIQQLTNDFIWQHVSRADNPADIISRGALPDVLVSSSLWWNGPQWLLMDSIRWPSTVELKPDSETPEVRKRKIITCASLNIDNFIDFNRFSSFRRLKRAVALILRFIHNIKPTNKNMKQTGPLSATELDNSVTLILKLVQHEVYSSEISRLNSGLPISNKSKILPLSPYLDVHGLIRVGGRLKHSHLSPDQRNQIIIPNHHIAQLIIRAEHYRLLHIGPQGLLNTIRQRYWLVGGRNIVRKTLNKCIVCFKVKPSGINQIMGELPAARVTPSRTFSNTSVDYCGPFFVKLSKRRGVKPTKAYIALFICYVTKAIHLELVEDMTTASFLSALQRFISRRGKPSDIYSDNGSNFIGADRELKELHKLFLSDYFNKELAALTGEEGIRWHFQPAKAPHMGGLHESGVRSIKYHIKRTVGKHNLTYFQFVTLLTQIEAIVNSRPLTPLSSNPLDLLPLTPSHFLVGDSLTALPVPNLESLNTNLLDHWQLTQRLAQHFWNRWAREYLNELQQRSKWRTEQENIKVGTLVLIRDDNLPPMNWKLGRVIQVHKGLDDKVRVVSLQTASGTYKRSIIKLCPLPIMDNQVSSSSSHHAKFDEVGTQDAPDDNLASIR